MHECGVSELSVPRGANTAYSRSTLPIEVGSILEVLLAEDYNHVLSVGIIRLGLNRLMIMSP
jgi:hypothetical protein